MTAQNTSPKTTADSSRDDIDAQAQAQIIQNKKRNKVNYIIFGGIFLAMVTGLILLGVYMVSSDKDTTPADTPAMSTEQVDRTVSGKSADQDRQDAVKSVENLLKEAYTTEGSYEDRVKAIEKGDTSSLTPEFTDSFRFTDAFAKDKSLQSVSYQSVIALSGAAFKSADDIKPVSDQSWRSVYVDSEAGIAYVPMSIFTNTSIPFTFEMVYIDGEWKLAPYSLVQSIGASSAMVQSMEQSASPAPAPKK